MAQSHAQVLSLSRVRHPYINPNMLKGSVSAPIGALLSIGMRWTDRLIGLISTLILARLLTPGDLGIVAMATLVIGIIDVMLDLGVNITLIQNRNANREHFDAAWTLRIIQSSLAALAVFFAAAPAAEYFQEPRVVEVMQVLSLSVFLAGCENIGIVAFQKNMEFGLEFRFFFVKRVIAFLATVAAAWWLRNYWALVIGTLVSRFTGTALSYMVHPMRPRLSFKRMKEILSFSSWILVRGIGNYLHTNLHQFVVGHRESSSVMGAYSLGGEIAAIPSTELLAPLSRVLFPAFVQVKDDPAQLKRAYLLALGIQTLIGVPAGLGLALVANELVLALLGDKWLAAVPFIEIIGTINVVTAIGTSGGYLLLALGRAKVSAISVWLQVIVFFIAVEWAIPNGDALAIAQLRLAVAGFGLILFSFFVSYAVPSLRLLERIGCIWRPVAASALMAVALHETPMPSELPVFVILSIKVCLGAAVYMISIMSLWLLALRPEGAESYLLEKLLPSTAASVRRPT
jgi:lipopolysaccharide exporter